MTAPKKYELFIAAPPGLEKVTLSEVESLPTLSNIKEISGGISVSSDLTGLVDLNISLGSANRVLLRLATFLAPTIPQFVKRCSHINWGDYLTAQSNVQCSISTAKSKLYHEKKIEQLLLEAIDKNHPHLLKDKKGKTEKIFIRIQNNHCTISIDTTGDHLHMRGYRKATAKAPIRENLAFGILKLINWKPNQPLIDPMCGSGTFVIEAARISCGVLPGIDRSFSFTNWPCLASQIEVIDKLKSNHLNASNLKVETFIQGFDKFMGAIKASHLNAQTAGVYSKITFEQKDFSKQSSDQKCGHIIINPPYGERIGKLDDLIELYQLIGKVAKERFKGWKITILCSNKSLRKEISLPLKSLTLINNGGIRVYVYHGQII
ncbi:MAG: hypothetical protein ISR65_11925 [Bacteriovoracaceae bacterium]|nr:hypothetical protein [Bacteriovoracaceae bacterium]